jgi:PIN domain nuclease of toxin-antitoxin system
MPQLVCDVIGIFFKIILQYSTIYQVLTTEAVGNQQTVFSDAVNSIYNETVMQIVPLTRIVVLAAGKLKCQYRDVLSYNDAIVIATAVHERAEVHTTEKEWPKIPKLEVVKYIF